jgi:hypothetical protein
MNKIKCYICKNEYSKEGFTRHIKACLKKNQDANPVSETGNKKETSYLIKVTDVYVPGYCLYLLIDGTVLLSTLDKYLRDIWLECCGHLSLFEINGYLYDRVPDDVEDYDMFYKLNEVLDENSVFSYNYDFGTTSNLRLKVMQLFSQVYKEKGIHLVGRNIAPEAICEKCKKDADIYAADVYSNTCSYLCESCFEKEEQNAEELYAHVITNSPRMGLCGYDSSSADILFMPQEKNQRNKQPLPDTGKAKRLFSEKFDEDCTIENFLDDFNSRFNDLQKRNSGFHIDISKTSDRSMFDYISLYRRRELDTIARNHGLRKISSMKKDELQKFLYKYIFENLENILLTIPSDVLFTYNALTEPDSIYASELEHMTDELEILCHMGLVFKIATDDRNDTYTVPGDLLQKVQHLSGSVDFKQKRRYPDKISGIMNTIFFYWGVVTYTDLYNETLRLSNESDLEKFAKTFRNCFINYENNYLDSEYINNTTYYSLYSDDIGSILLNNDWHNLSYVPITNELIPEKTQEFIDLAMHNPYIQNIFALLTQGIDDYEIMHEELNKVLDLAETIINAKPVPKIKDIIDEFELYDLPFDNDKVWQNLEYAIASTPNYWLKGNSISGKIMTVNSPEIEVKCCLN